MEIRESRDIEITVLMDNFYDGLLPENPDVSRFGLTREGRLAPPLAAEHGLSYFIRWRSDKEHTLLLDFGLSARGVRDNAEVLGVDLGLVEALVLSHGHFDHYGGLGELRELLPRGIPFYAGEDAFRHRYLKQGDGVADAGELPRQLLSDFRVELVSAPREILPGALLSGEIPRRTDYEKGAPNLLVETADGLVPDGFPGEEALAFRTGRGLVVISSCAHAGIVNTVRHFREITGEERLRAVIGGFHLSGAPAEKIEATVADLAALGPERIVPMHCTGLLAEKAFLERLPQTGLNAVGSTWRF